MAKETTLTFLPWASTGVTATLPRPAGNHAQRPPVTLAATITATTAAGATQRTANPTLRLVGPGDVTGIDAGQIVRSEPHDGATDVETTLFPSVEFNLPTLPWLFTAAQPAGAQLMPWVRLITVSDIAGVRLDPQNRTLVLPASELPDASEAWAWAHVQYNGPPPTDAQNNTTAAAMAAALDDPAKSISRLVCPRVLAAHTRYLACVVPTTTVGQRAGLGEIPTADDEIRYDWPPADADGSVRLPVYHHFCFTTGDAGDFASLAARLTAPLTGGIVPRPPPAPRLQTSWTDASGAPQSFTRPMPTVLAAEPDLTTGAQVPDSLISWLLSRLEPTQNPPQLTPPVYGAIQAGTISPNLTATGPRWMRELNTDPRLRVAAGLGAQVVTADREAIVAAAFAQTGEITEVNARLSRGQLARAVRSRVLTKHLAGHDALSTLQLLGPLTRRLPVPATVTGGPPAAAADLAAAAPDPRLPVTIGAAYRRLTRPRGPHATAISLGYVPTVPATLTPATLLTSLTPQPAQPTDRILREFVTPATTALAAGRPDTLRGLAPALEFHTAMWAPLVALSPDSLLPGATEQPMNSLQALPTDPRVIAAYLVGLNYATARLLSWRSVPTERTASPFRRFWNPEQDTIPPIAEWPTTSGLADIAGPAQTVLVARADLFRRYPNTAVYAVAAQPTPPRFKLDATTPQIQPRYTALLPPDTRLFVFPIDLTDPRSTPGYFLVFQEQVHETRFGDPHPPPAGPAPNYRSLTELTAPGAPAPTDASAVAELTRKPPVLVAIAAQALTTTSRPPQQ